MRVTIHKRDDGKRDILVEGGRRSGRKQVQAVGVPKTDVKQKVREAMQEVEPGGPTPQLG